ncbi:hypothetical protein BDW02DRAFT_570611 [Decorospora gaudefroyi]|uniref:Uncharacterized protein n=1 Tax=Decorospora gaudefroyi TaxID=184978 RepID=A0A6A5K9F0_9PLEO|nr:hypothetical protein BDW02DRAFT_570611 [Decorospora gaudefroyi]
MAPPHALRKSTHTTASQTTTRQGAQQSRMQVIEEVDECDDEVETEESQGTTDVALEQLMTKMVDNERKRYASQKKGVGKAYNANRATVEKAINTVFDEHEEYA